MISQALEMNRPHQSWFTSSKIAYSFIACRHVYVRFQRARILGNGSIRANYMEWHNRECFSQYCMLEVHNNTDIPDFGDSQFNFESDCSASPLCKNMENECALFTNRSNTESYVYSNEVGAKTVLCCCNDTHMCSNALVPQAVDLFEHNVGSHYPLRT